MRAIGGLYRQFLYWCECVCVCVRVLVFVYVNQCTFQMYIEFILLKERKEKNKFATTENAQSQSKPILTCVRSFILSFVCSFVRSMIRFLHSYMCREPVFVFDLFDLFYDIIDQILEVKFVTYPIFQFWKIILLNFSWMGVTEIISAVKCIVKIRNLFNFVQLMTSNVQQTDATRYSNLSLRVEMSLNWKLISGQVIFSMRIIPKRVSLVASIRF